MSSGQMLKESIISLYERRMPSSMSRPFDYMYEVSERLSKVMADIGVNERVVMKKRRAISLKENIAKLSYFDNENSVYFLGSQSEGSTTLGLHSDVDTLVNINTSNVIHNLSEWKPGAFNFKIIQDENISPGYCYLQVMKYDISLPATCNDDVNNIKYCVTDSGGGILLENTCLIDCFDINDNSIPSYINGPAITKPATHQYGATDTVLSYGGESSPHQVVSWLQTQRKCNWPTEDVLEKCRNVGCFVVPVGSKESYNPELEWRISTSLQERFLMFSLNITQLRCYVLMKMIIRTHIDPAVEGVLSSFMCKNVLLYCITNSSHDWHTGNLLSYLHLGLFMLKECVEQRNCPHFMIPENNLLAGRMTDTQRGKIMDIINNLMKNDEQFLFEMQMDDLGIRLKVRLNIIAYPPKLQSCISIYQKASSLSVFQIAETMSRFLNMVLMQIDHNSSEMALQYLLLTKSKLERDKREGDVYQNTACELLIPLVSSTLGSVLASSKIDTHTAVSHQAFTYLEAGKQSDALSGRLKLVSVLYCTEDMERAERELRIIETQYSMSELQSVKDVTTLTNNSPLLKFEYVYACVDFNETTIKSHLAISTRFLQCEINCIPHELRYEILRSYIEEDRQMRSYLDNLWMNSIFVDSIIYLYFLQYKIYGHLQRRKEQQKALSNLEQTIKFEPDLGHMETALNLLGQCMEQADRQKEAFQCYILSLKHRVRNNAARFLLCIQLVKLWKQDNTL